MSRTSVRFQNVMSSPPGGKFFFEAGGERVEGRCFQEILPKVRHLMSKYKIQGAAEIVLANYMCPRLGQYASLFCQGPFDASDEVGRTEALENCDGYYNMPAATFDVIERRLARCMTCPKHYRGWCLTCTGHYDRMMSAFGGRRPRLPVDRGTGVCLCARAYEAVIATPDYGKGDRIWEGAPDTCWRKNDV